MTIPVARWTQPDRVPDPGEIRSSQGSSFGKPELRQLLNDRADHRPGSRWKRKVERALSADESVWVGEGTCDRRDGYMGLGAVLGRRGKRRILAGEVRLMIQPGLGGRAVMDG